jgi:hypothetical protein
VYKLGTLDVAIRQGVNNLYVLKSFDLEQQLSNQ